MLDKSYSQPGNYKLTCNSILSIDGQIGWNAEEAAVIEPLEKPSVRGVVIKGEDPSGIVASEYEYPAVGTFIKKYPFPQTQVPDKKDILGAAVKDKLPAVLVVVNPGPEIDVVVLIP